MDKQNTEPIQAVRQYPLPDPFVCDVHPENDAPGAMGMYHCGDCGNMVLSGLPHPKLTCDECEETTVYLTPDQEAILCARHYQAYCVAHNFAISVSDPIESDPVSTDPAHADPMDTLRKSIQSKANGKSVHVYDKLVRDKIDEIVISDGNVAEFRFVEGDEYFQMAEQKLQEEVKEYLMNPCLEELADILEIVRCLSGKYGDLITLEHAAAEKRQKRGGFKRGLVMVWAEK